ncbi:MAG TPA: hypothetical protein VFQ77_16440, partial [Pseudonocardiaceae bacterium]|nr:hypothetical protein [Pseudonocardiaceae bacterium]
MARLAREMTTRGRELTMQIHSLKRELPDRVRVLAPSLLAIPGCGVLSAAVILGKTARAPTASGPSTPTPGSPPPP